MDAKAYWSKKLLKYAEEDWANKPSLFAQWALQYFPKNARLLELGTGQGQDARYFQEQELRVTATDFSETGLEMARAKSSKEIDFKLVDFSQPLPFEDATFDVVYSHLALHYFTEADTQKLFAEIKRILKPSGILAALFNTTADPETKDAKEIEPNFYELNGIQKRFFDPEIARKFAESFEVLVADSDGTTYKDREIGVNNLIRLVARKNT